MYCSLIGGSVGDVGLYSALRWRELDMEMIKGVVVQLDIYVGYESR